MEIDKYMIDRVDVQLKYYEKAANRTKRIHVTMKSAIIVMGLVIPVVSNLPMEWGAIKNIEPLTKMLVTVLSLSMAILTALSDFRKHGELWLAYRRTEELLKQEKYLFLTGSGPYLDKKKADHDFVERIESIISAEHSHFRTITDAAKQTESGHRPVGKTTSGPNAADG